ncbi:MAG: hypothetical protein KKF77_03450 [Proteobacteria bacterium]|nr:hypothetical protein [Pseudomonadota bacterium]
MATDYDIADAWAQALEADTELTAFCVSRFGKAPQVMLGVGFGNALGENDTPYIMVIPLRNQDGFEEELAVPEVVLSIGVVDTTSETFGTRGIRARGYKSLDLFEGLILSVLKDTDYAPSRWEGENDQPGEYFFIRHIRYACDIPRTI